MTEYMDIVDKAVLQITQTEPHRIIGLHETPLGPAWRWFIIPKALADATLQERM